MQEPTETDVQDNASEVIAKALGKTSGNIELNDTVPISIYESYRETDLFRSVTCELEALDPHDEYSLVTTIFDTTKKT